MRVLCLHGFTQNANLFAKKTAALRKALNKNGHETVFIDAPVKVGPSDVPFDAAPDVDMRSWWIPSESSPEYRKLDRAFAAVKAAILQHGIFDGVIGFSQGAALAAVISQCVRDLEPTHPEIKFCVLYSGFRLHPEAYKFNRNLTTPSLHVLGTLDTIVSEERSLGIWDLCDTDKRQMLKHPGSHYVPAQKGAIDTVLKFIESFAGNGGDASKPAPAQKTVADENWDAFDKIGA